MDRLIWTYIATTLTLTLTLKNPNLTLTLTLCTNHYSVNVSLADTNRGVLMGLTDRRKTAKNLVDSRKNWKILTVSRK